MNDDYGYMGWRSYETRLVAHLLSEDDRLWRRLNNDFDADWVGYDLLDWWERNPPGSEQASEIDSASVDWNEVSDHLRECVPDWREDGY